MKTVKLVTAIIALILLTNGVEATTLFVNVNNPVPVAPYTNWLTAATNIQDAIDVASNGDTVLVTNGVYAYGGKVMAGDLTNRVAISNAITVQSANGPWLTTILGAGATNGTAAVRCAWLTNGASLIGFTLRGGGTRASGASTLGTGGGVWCASTNALVANCLIYSNTAFNQGAGIYQGTFRSCAIYGNNAQNSYATYNSFLNNCTVVGNGGFGGAFGGWLTNCIIYYNSNNNSLSSWLYYCCTYPLPGSGAGNFTNAPQLFVDNVHLFTNSPCIGAGTSLGAGTDIDGRPWANPPAIGCSEAPTVPYVGQPIIQLTNNLGGFTVNAAITGAGALNCWWLKDGSLLQDNGHFSSTQTAALAVSGVSYSDAGNYQLVVSNAFGVVTSLVAQVVIHCVDAAGTNSVAPYLSWTTAATNIQDAITASAIGEIVLVTNGLYASGGKSMDGVITNRVSVDKAILVVSVSGPNVTVIQGAWDPTSTKGPGAMRCAWLTTNAILSGFTLQGGATRDTAAVSFTSVDGGGVFGMATSAMVNNCQICSNFAFSLGGGAYKSTLSHCTLKGNYAIGNSASSGSGGGAEACNLINCLVTSNVAGNSGGGADSCNAINSAFTQNSCLLSGGAANGGSLINCTFTANTASGYSSGYGAAVFGAKLTNCIVFGNFSRTSYPNTNYGSCTLAYCDAHPLSAGTGNTNVNPQLLGDGFHLAATSPCIGAGTASVVAGTDIDGQPWNNPPAMGCDQWLPAPVIGAQPAFQIGSPPHGLTCSVVVAGQTPFSFFWSKDGTPIQDDGHHSNSGTASLIVNYFGPDDAGVYQVVVTNSSGAVTSALAKVVIHAVDAASANPVSPYASWTNASTTIQDAINAAAAGDIILVTNGVYSTGGMVMAGDLTNRVALNKAVIMMSVDGYKSTIIQGAWDPIATNGPGAVRCAWVGDGAVLSGFTLQNGATHATGDGGFLGGPLQSGGGIWCNSSNGIVANCLLTNNSASYGGGMAYGTLNNSLIIGNSAQHGGGALYSTLNNCTVENNAVRFSGGGTYMAIVRNSIVVGNYDLPNIFTTDNYYASGQAQYYYSCSSPPLPAGRGNINADPKFLDLFHLSTISPCFGAGSAAYASGFDLDGEAWNNPPSMGCDEMVVSNLTGPLTATVFPGWTNVLVNRTYPYLVTIAGRATSVTWSFGDGTIYTNFAANSSHQWTNGGDYTVTATVFNNDNTAGVSGNILVHVQPLTVPQIQSAVWLTNGFQFQFMGQTNANYTIQYATNLVPPVSWQTLQSIFYSSGGVIQINDSAWTNAARFYRVLVQ